MTTNKEIIDRLVHYFVQQDPYVVAKVLANFFVDMHRIYHYEQLEPTEAFVLEKRIEMNMQALEDFIEHGPKGPLSFGTYINREKTYTE